MRLIHAYQELLKLHQGSVSTQDAAALLKLSAPHASKMLSRLSESQLFVHLSKGVWAFPQTDPLTIPESLTAPWPSYISLQTALYYHEMISQIPENIYAISLSRTKIYKTPLGTFSIHRIHPNFFFGFEIIGKGIAKMASPEKALLDLLYLTPAKSRLFKTLPEILIPKNFRMNLVKKYISRILSISRRTLVKMRFEEIGKQ
ncbi:MAG: hypothetical protein HYS07_03635 [Chlamydiae bacterium]|nr:hypothetical protein [Chlamydiota bacterium]MBI3276441.1 hypothetical protein [Chlamydiota bacterium]